MCKNNLCTNVRLYHSNSKSSSEPTELPATWSDTSSETCKLSTTSSGRVIRAPQNPAWIVAEASSRHKRPTQSQISPLVGAASLNSCCPWCCLCCASCVRKCSIQQRRKRGLTGRFRATSAGCATDVAPGGTRRSTTVMSTAYWTTWVVRSPAKSSQTSSTGVSRSLRLLKW